MRMILSRPVSFTQPGLSFVIWDFPFGFRPTTGMGVFRGRARTIGPEPAPQNSLPPGCCRGAGLWILREKVLKPVFAGDYRPKRCRPPKNIHPLDVYGQDLQRDMLATLQTLKIIA